MTDCGYVQIAKVENGKWCLRLAMKDENDKSNMGFFNNGYRQCQGAAQSLLGHELYPKLLWHSNDVGTPKGSWWSIPDCR